MADVDTGIGRILSVNGTGAAETGLSSLSQACHASLTEVFGSRSSEKIKISVKLEHLHNVAVPSFEMQRILSNLIENAYHATGEEDSVWIFTRETKYSIISIIGNSGSSLSKEDSFRVFDQFFTKNKKGGLRLGLAIVKKLVTDYKGTVKCLSSNNNVEFEIELPKSDGDESFQGRFPEFSGYFLIKNTEASLFGLVEKPIPQGNHTSQINDGAKISILIVDDEDIYRRDLISQFNSLQKDFDFNIFEARNMNEASDISNKIHVDMCIITRGIA